MVANFAICTFRATGPLKTWSDIRAAHVHNSRAKPIPHAIANAMEPTHLIGTGDLVVDVKAKLIAADIDPTRLRKNGVIAYEAIMTASPAFFDAGDASEQASRVMPWAMAQVKFAKARYGLDRIASMVLHEDEKTPHVHLVVVPLELVVDGRRKDGVARWSLVGRSISGPGMFDQLQDDYAAAMKRFGLERGERGSGRKHEPVPVYLERMAAKERAVDAAAVAAERDQAALRADRARIVAADEAIRRRASRIAEAEAELADGEADLASRQASFARFRDELIVAREKLAPIVAAAKDFLRVAGAMRPNDIVPAARPVVVAAQHVVEVCRAAQGPAPHTASIAQHLSQQVATAATRG